MNAGFQDRVVFVAGSRGAIGEPLCFHFLSCGARVVGFSRSPTRLEHKCFLHRTCDIRDGKAVTEMFFELEQSGVVPDVLIINAGRYSSHALSLLTAQEMDEVLSVNLKGPLLVIREAMKRMMRNSFGRIVAVSSIRVSHPEYGSGLYSISKAALEQLVRALAVELAPCGGTANGVAVGLFQGGMADRLTSAAKERILDSLVIKRPCSAEDLCNAVEFFARPGTSYITGQILRLGFL